jgi:hypothetical protein
MIGPLSTSALHILPKDSDSPREASKHFITEPAVIAAAFACAVTVRSNSESLVARNGELSIFSAYRRIFPQAISKLIFLLSQDDISNFTCLLLDLFTGVPARVAKVSH